MFKRSLDCGDAPTQCGISFAFQEWVRLASFQGVFHSHFPTTCPPVVDASSVLMSGQWSVHNGGRLERTVPRKLVLCLQQDRDDKVRGYGEIAVLPTDSISNLAGGYHE